jgi:hypothetical protein
MASDSLQKYVGKASYTLGDDTAFTVGMSNTFTVGPTVSASLGGQAAFTLPMNATFSAGTYLAAVLGNNVAWNSGDTMNLSYGASVNYATDTTQQARDSYKIMAGLQNVPDIDLNILIENAIQNAQYVIKILFAVNLAMSAGNEIKDSTEDVGKQTSDAARGRVAATVIATSVTAAANFAACVALNKVISKLKTLYSQLKQISVLNLSKDAASLSRVENGGFGPTSSILMQDKSLAISRKMTDVASMLEMTDSETWFGHLYGIHSSKVSVDGINGSISNSKDASISVSSDSSKLAWSTTASVIANALGTELNASAGGTTTQYAQTGAGFKLKVGADESTTFTVQKDMALLVCSGNNILLNASGLSLRAATGKTLILD